MSARVLIHNALGRIPSNTQSKILAGVQAGIDNLSQYITVDDVDISIVPNDYVHELTGYGGMAFGPEYCAIYADPNNPYLLDHCNKNLPAIVTHELHHVLRMRSFEYSGSNAWCGGSVVVLEGLATQCERFLGYGQPVNVVDVTLDDVKPLIEKLKPVAADKQADWYWIYTLNGLPRYNYKAVYPMGYFLVGAYLQETGRNPIEAICDPWEEIWDIGMIRFGL